MEEFKKSIKDLTNFFNGNFITEVKNLEWIKPNDKNNLDIKNISYLTKMFFKNNILLEDK